MGQEAELVRRVSYLDMQVGDHRARSLAGFEHFIRAMDEVTPSSVMVGIDPILPETADAMTDGSTLLLEMNDLAPEVVTGPISLDKQYWIGTGKPATVPSPHRRLSRRYFIDVSATVAIEASTKPFGVGLHTSTGLAGLHGIWELYLEATQSTLFPMPWHIWAVHPRSDVEVLEIANVVDWAEFVCSYSRQQGDLVYPDWLTASRDFDAVHVTLRAIAGMQGIYLRTWKGILAPSYWGVESTLWLHWCFHQAELVGARTHMGQRLQ